MAWEGYKRGCPGQKCFAMHTKMAAKFKIVKRTCIYISEHILRVSTTTTPFLSYRLPPQMLPVPTVVHYLMSQSTQAPDSPFLGDPPMCWVRQTKINKKKTTLMKMCDPFVSLIEHHAYIGSSLSVDVVPVPPALEILQCVM